MGLGYVGLPLAIKLSSHFSVIGYDVSKKRIKELEDNYDNTNEVKKSVLKNAKNIVLTNICGILLLFKYRNKIVNQF